MTTRIAYFEQQIIALRAKRRRQQPTLSADNLNALQLYKSNSFKSGMRIPDDAYYSRLLDSVDAAIAEGHLYHAQSDFIESYF